MLDEKDLQAIAQILTTQKTEIMEETKALLSEQKREIMGEVQVLLESEVTPKFNLLADSIDNINEKLKVLPDPDLMDKMQDELDLHHEMIKLHTKEINRFKKAN